jgi:hypothetical protein
MPDEPTCVRCLSPLSDEPSRLFRMCARCRSDPKAFAVLCTRCMNSGVNVTQEPCECPIGREIRGNPFSSQPAGLKWYESLTITRKAEAKMNAAIALAMTRTAEEAGAGQKQIVLDLWHTAIRKAAEKALRSVRECDLDVPRCPISYKARQAARAQLVADGFDVQQVATGSIESTFIASW